MGARERNSSKRTVKLPHGFVGSADLPLKMDNRVQSVKLRFV
jgi:hypothetical protein